MSGPISFINGKSRSVVCESSAEPDPDSYSWHKAGGSIRTGNTLTLNPVQKQDDSQFTCTANNTMVPSNGNQETGSSSSTVKINVLCKLFLYCQIKCYICVDYNSPSSDRRILISE